jgi:vacuolar-type H+-ATPase subunit H
LPQLRDFIGRFRPASIPADRHGELAAELRPVLALLAPTDNDCAQIIAAARETAARISAGARRQVSEIEATAGRRAQAAREEAVEQVLVHARDQARRAMDEAAVAASRRPDPAEWQVKELISEALRLVLTAPGTGPG